MGLSRLIQHGAIGEAAAGSEEKIVPWIISMVEYAAEELDKRHKAEPWST